jgi:predicted Rossmann-fold nucleotide-binding protein
MARSTTESGGGRFVSLGDEEAVRDVLRTTVLDLWKAVNNLSRLRPSKHERYRVAVFGSARARPGTVAYEEVKRVAAAVAAMGCDIVTGGGPGLMQAANEGAASAGGSGSVGIGIELPFE